MTVVLKTVILFLISEDFVLFGIPNNLFGFYIVIRCYVPLCFAVLGWTVCTLAEPRQPALYTLPLHSVNGHNQLESFDVKVEGNCPMEVNIVTP